MYDYLTPLLYIERFITSLHTQSCAIMNKQRKNLLLVAGVISSILGLIIAVPAMLQAQYLIATGGSILLVGGLVLLALGFGE